MPYLLKKIKNGYKVCKKDDSKCFSKKPLTKSTATRQMKAIYANESDTESDEESDGELEGGLKPLTARIGGKVLLKKTLVNKYFPDPSTYKTYVEPFVGGGSVYFYKNKDGKKEAVNDIDPDIYTIFKGFQNYDSNILKNDLNGDYSSDDFKKIKASNPTTEYKKFLKTYLLYRLSYFGLGQTYGKPRINSKFEGYMERLNSVDISKEDWKKVVDKYNDKDTFFYLDPPVSHTSVEYKYPPVDVHELISVLKTIKGLFCLTYANTYIKKELFKDFNVYTVETNYVGEKSKGGQSKKTKEYVITNYKPPNIERNVGGCATCHMTGIGKPQRPEPITAKCNGCMGKCGKGMVKFHKQLKEIGLTHDKYMKQVKLLAKDTGYDPSKVEMSIDEDHKCVYHSPDGDVYFGKVGYADFIIYSWLEQQGEEEEGTAESRRNAYLARASKIGGKWKDNKYSPNNLAINLLWGGNT